MEEKEKGMDGKREKKRGKREEYRFNSSLRALLVLFLFLTSLLEYNCFTRLC